MTMAQAARSDGWQDSAVRAAAAAIRCYIQNCPWRFGKVWVWKVIWKYITCRSLEISARTRDGLVFVGSFPDSIHSFLYFFGVWEPAITAYLRSALKPGEVFIDIGANVGTHSLLASRLVGAFGRVHAIEASPFIFNRLCGNLQRNGATNVRAYHVAVSDRSGPVPVFLHDERNLGGTTIVAAEAALVHAMQEQVVEGRQLHDILPREEICAARLIKIDVEGAEWLVLNGMRELLPALRPDAELLVEVNTRALAAFGASFQDLRAMFATAGFVPFQIANLYTPEFYVQSPPAPVPLRGELAFGDLLLRRQNNH
ncbi:MAG TPA: FkbM family methyltransferase [Acetobacteraceae bacterium]|nr:FkbM family methyltransferase [Acetobacteraceae bacterium]